MTVHNKCLTVLLDLRLVTLGRQPARFNRADKVSYMNRKPVLVVAVDKGVRRSWGIIYLSLMHFLPLQVKTLRNAIPLVTFFSLIPVLSASAVKSGKPRSRGRLSIAAHSTLGVDY